MLEEKKLNLNVARTRESLPFGLKIREAAYKASYGRHDSNHPILARYSTKNDLVIV